MPSGGFWRNMGHAEDDSSRAHAHNSTEDVENQELDFGTAEPLRNENNPATGSGASAPSESIRPSNASAHSEASSYQSSLFSRDASTMNTMTTMDSASTSNAPHPLDKQQQQLQQQQLLQGAGSSHEEAGDQSSEMNLGKAMTVVDLDDIPQLAESEESTNQQQPPQPRRQQRNYCSSYGTAPDVDLTSNDLFSALNSPTLIPSNIVRGSPGPSSSANSPRHSMPNISLTVGDELKRLGEDLSSVLSQTLSGEMTISKGGSSVLQALKTSTQSPVMSTVSPGDVAFEHDANLRKSLKIVLHFTDNLLRPQQHHSTKMYILRSLYELGVKLKLVSPSQSTVPYPVNFSIGSTVEQRNQKTVQQLMDNITNSDDPMISEQEGAFIAPILRGLSPEFSVLCLTFGFPNPEANHYNMVSTLCDFAPDIHIYCQQNYIRACSGGGRFKAPFRSPVDASAPPMAMSLATEDATNLSGTLGGYVYPKIDPSHNLYSHYGKSTFALTCAHTCLTESGGLGQPLVCTPSPVLIGLYKKALEQERDKYTPNSEERIGYQQAVNEIDEEYPPSKDKKQNQPKGRLGVVSWAERQVVNGSLSDVAIIKCNDGLKCRNFLGDDVSFSEYDPALMFGNLHVKRIVRKLTPGMNVFKYGSTTKYTKGTINGLRIVYWASGKLQSSEFAVASDSMFASGGDSGAWILQKSEDAVAPSSISDGSTVRANSDGDSTTTTSSSNGNCLGAVGMLHSYDGERREFGLFSPIDSILERLHQVTRIRWGVVGVPEDDSDDVLAGGSESETSEGSSSEGER